MFRCVPAADVGGTHTEAVIDSEVEQRGAHGGVPEREEGLQGLQQLVGALRCALQQQHLKHADLHAQVSITQILVPKRIMSPAEAIVQLPDARLREYPCPPTDHRHNVGIVHTTSVVDAERPLCVWHDSEAAHAAFECCTGQRVSYEMVHDAPGQLHWLCTCLLDLCGRPSAGPVSLLPAGTLDLYEGQFYFLPAMHVFAHRPRQLGGWKLEDLISGAHDYPATLTCSIWAVFRQNL